MKLDRTDFELLESLQRNARLTNKELAARIGISPSTCLERVRRLVAKKAIRGFHADVHPTAVGIGVQALISIRLGRHAEISFDSLLKELTQLKEVIHVYLLAGSQDLLVHVAVKDVAHLRALVVDQFTTRPDVAHIETSLIFEFAKSVSLPNYRIGETERE
ncbi:MAG TPA: Lrp/AsnC family transcriptional regulator [Pirellulaceae bacterium]